MIVYPNPVNNEVNIRMLKGQVIRKVEITDMLGNIKAIQQCETSQVKIIIAKFVSGIYLMKITDEDNNTVVRKLSKN